MDIKAPGFTRFSRFDTNLGRIHPTEVVYTEGLDGTDTLAFTCPEDVDKGEYIVWRDRQGVWHEQIVDAAKRMHDDSGAPYTVATCINSINETWDDFIIDKRPSGSVDTALAAILEPSRWSAGVCTQGGTAARVFYHVSVREGLRMLVETWGGELVTVITCDGSKVTGREVRILSMRGNQYSTKRFTWTKDLVSITRDTPSDNPKSRLYAYGKGVETDTGGYGRRIGIESVNGGKAYVEDAAATLLWGHPMPDGTIAPAVGVYVNEQCEDPSQLKTEALAALDVAKEPRAQYTADVIDLVSFGRDWEDVSLGDLVTIIDKEFSDDGVRLKGRVSKITRDLLTYDTTVTFGNLYDALVNPWQSLHERLASLNARSSNWDMAGSAQAAWLDTLIAGLNAAYNQAGTYHYSSFEKGEIWSSVPLDDNGNPTQSGGWAMNINGLGFRLASSTNVDGTWNWRTFGTGQGFTADEMTTGTLRAILIRDLADNGNYWNLETGDFRLAATASINGRTAQQLLQDVDATITGVDVEYAQNQSATTAPSSGWATTAPAWQSGYYIWTRTKTVTPGGTTYSTPVMISGRDGTDGTSVSILGSYNTLADLQTAHPIGSVGDGYIVGGDLYVWDGTQWANVGNIRGPAGTNGTDGADGSQIWTATADPTTPDYTFALSALSGPSGVTPQVGDLVVRSYYRYTIASVGVSSVLTSDRTSIRGADGADGVGITSTTITYGTSASASTQPESWQSSVPTITQGQWLWVKTVYAYSDSSEKTTYSKSYAGTDGEDGTSVYVQSASKVGDTTTVVIADSDGNTNTLTIRDGEDGTDGTAGASGYVHTAWATSADGSQGFSTSVSAGKTYLGVYTDNTAADSQTYSDYSWSLIKGADGSDGLGISSIIEQYYLSTSESTRTGGTWTYNQPTWQEGRYIWTRSEITWDDGTTTTTTPILARALTQANSEAKAANDKADDNATTLTNLQTQQAIFNLLTNNGAIQGLYMQGGQLYINANYLVTGYIGDVSGKSYWDLGDGTIVIVNATKNRWNRNEKLKFSTLSFTDTSGWLNTITTAQTLAGLMIGDDYAGATSGRGNIHIIPNLPANSASNAGSISAIASKYPMKIMGNYSSGSGAYYRGCLSLGSRYIELNMVYGTGTVYPGIVMSTSSLYLCATRDDYLTNNGSSITTLDAALILPAGKTTAATMYRGLGVYGNLRVYKRSDVASATNSAVTLGEDSSSRYVNLKVYGSGNFQNGLSVSGTKSRVASTKDYSERLLYSYETPTPYFGDIGSGTIGEDGFAYVLIDDIFSETARTDIAYQAFLQKCGQGDLWVADKQASYFVVQGTPGLQFDWEIKARQTGFESLRLENYTINESLEPEYDIATPEQCYADEYGYVRAIEALQYGA